MRNNGRMTNRYIRASELRTFSFCRRAWHPERRGRASLLQPERDRGQADHRQHSGAVISATAAARFSKLSFAALVIALLWWQW